MLVSIGISNHHVHMTKEHLEILFGKDYELTKKSDLTQPEQYASTDTITIKTQKTEIKNVRILGPLREYTQVEISKTDARTLGIDPPIRNSGDLKGSAPITLVGPYGSLQLEQGCIIPTRHIHISYDALKEYGLENVKMVNVKVGNDKASILTHVYLKPMEEAFFELHLDTDDGNANLLKSGDLGEIIL